MTTKKENRGGKRPGSGRPKKDPTKTIATRVPEKHAEQLKKEFNLIAFCLVLLDELGGNTVNGMTAKFAYQNKRYSEIIKTFGDQAFRDAPESMAKILSKPTMKKLRKFYDNL